MGVYIKNMEMPFTCLTCDFHRCAGGVGDFCSLTKRRQFRFKNRPKDCPLAPVPPHGALIEKNAVFELIRSFPNVDRHLPVEFMKALYELPTVIPAEEVYGQYTDTAGNLHWTGAHSGEHTVKAEEGET